MELFSDSTCCSHAWACYPTEMRYLVVTYMKSERAWTIPMPLTWILYIFLMADDWQGSLIEIYIGLPRVFNAFLRFYFLNTTILQIYWVTKSASNVYGTRDVQLFSRNSDNHGQIYICGTFSQECIYTCSAPPFTPPPPTMLDKSRYFSRVSTLY